MPNRKRARIYILSNEHIEDEVLNRGVAGARDAINFMQSIRDMLVGHSESRVNITTKWDGCLSGNSVLITNDGTKTLKEIFQSWHSNKEIWVLCYDIEKNIDCFMPIISAQASKSFKQWVKVEFEKGFIICTSDHEIYTNNRGWVNAENLTENDDVKTSESINMDDNHLYLQIGNEHVQIKRNDICK